MNSGAPTFKTGQWPMPTFDLGGYVVVHRHPVTALVRVQNNTASKGQGECTLSQGEITPSARVK